MNLLMISGDRSIVEGRKGAFWYTLHGLAKHWDRIDIICPHGRASNNKSNDVIKSLENKSVFFHPNPKGILSQSSWVTKKGAVLHAKHEYAAMTIHEYPPFYNGRGGLRLAERTGIPTLLEIHHIVGLPRAVTLSEWIGRRISRWYFPKEAKSATVVRTVNGEIRDILASWSIPEEKIQVLPSFYLDKEAINSVKAEAKKFDLVFCARLVSNKGLERVLEALLHLPERNLLVIGDGPNRHSYERYAQDLGVSDRVKFTGWLPEQRDVIVALKSARVFLMNSTSEGGPRSALEAMACGLPVIATPVGVMPDVLEEGVNGLFTTGEASDLVDCVNSILADSSVCSAMGKEAVSVLNHFEREYLLKQYSDSLLTLK